MCVDVCVVNRDETKLDICFQNFRSDFKFNPNIDQKIHTMELASLMRV